MACGVATIILAVGAYRSLEDTRTAFYERSRFGNVFATAVHAPKHLKERIDQLPGVAASELRIVKSVLVDVEGMKEPASGIAVSIPDFQDATVNRLYLRKGRLPSPERTNEVAVVEEFAKAHDFEIGDRFATIMNGSRRTVHIVGIVLSPEFIYATGPGDMVSDQRRFGVFFMPERMLAGVFDMTNSFNDLSVSLLRGTSERTIIETLDQMLKPYGGTGAYDRSDQVSHAFLEAELDQLQAMAAVIPPIFLFVSAFLVNMILSRLVALEREQIGLLKALGYGNYAIGGHYAKLVVLISVAGLLIGSFAGLWLGQGLTRLYASFFSFPFLIFRQSVDLYVLAGGVTVTAALLGAIKAIWSIVTLAPAVAMRPPAPETYRSLLGDFMKRISFLSQLTVMALRQLARRPVRAMLTTFGTSLSVAILVTALFSYDSIDYMIDIVFFQAERQDASINFSANAATDALIRVKALPGVLVAEPFRATQVRLRNGHRELKMALMGLPRETRLSRVLDTDLKPVRIPEAGLLLSERVAAKLDIRPGELIDVELTRKDGRIETAVVTGVVQSYVGLTAYGEINFIDRLLRDGHQISGVNITIDSNRLNDLYAAVKQMPFIASIALLDNSRNRFRETIEQNITTMTSVYVILAVIITFGVIYNSARIQLSERARELASLRVFGFTKAEVSWVLMVELGIIVILAQPLGWSLGYGFAWSVVRGFESDLFRIPFVIDASTFAWASIVVLTAASASALIVRRRVNRLDLIRVLKTRE